MYTSEFFAETDQDEIDRLIAYNALAAVVSFGAHGFDATHAPLLFEPGRERQSLIGHMARPNDHWRRIRPGDPVLAIFRGPDAYVTPSLYVVEPDVPTWNYSAVHVHGTWDPIMEAERSREVLNHSVDAYENTRGSGWQMSQIEPDLVTSLSRGIFAFRINITRIEAAQKLSQDKCLADVKAVQSGMSACPMTSISNAMQAATIDRKKYIEDV